MSYNPFFSLKATNSNIASFSSTEEETYILLIANDIEKQTENGTIKNSANSNAIFSWRYMGLLFNRIMCSCI